MIVQKRDKKRTHVEEEEGTKPEIERENDTLRERLIRRTDQVTPGSRSIWAVLLRVVMWWDGPLG